MWTLEDTVRIFAVAGSVNNRKCATGFTDSARNKKYTSMDTFQDQLKKPLYKNWVKGGLAYQYLKDDFARKKYDIPFSVNGFGLADFTASTDNMITLVKDKKGLYLNENAKKAVENIKQLKRNDIYITTQNEADVFEAVTTSNKERKSELEEFVESAEQEPVSKDFAEKANNDDVAQSPSISDTSIGLLQLRCEVNLIKKSLAEIKQLEEVRNAQQNTLKYISQKQELQKKLIKLYQNEQVKTWISPLATQDNNINISKVYVHPKMYIEDSEKDTISDYTKRSIQNFHELFCDIQNDTSQRGDIIEQASDTQQKCHNKLKNIYIIGEVGTGKSGFCKILINSWCNSRLKPNADATARNEKCLLDLHKVSTYDFLFYVQMCNIPGDIVDVRQMVIHSMYGIASDSLIESIFSKESERCLIIIDGLDEWSQPEQPRRSQRHIKTGIPLTNNVNNATVLTTSSPSAKGILNLKKSQYDRKIKLVGIDENEIQNMIKLYMEAFGESLKCNADKDLDFINELKAANFPHPERTPLLLISLLL
ncbi:uncharacterized protein LOC132760002 [Ruditapes philippinarum]|uniref:uncharacterized protein LOC132760002 n=1 Tax=Ruditapes philippinarum TaxID=129788 RepID=UPI00295B57B6|nr:uncharacterized protein LOC132760002 [Ruditapes philippinarum]